MYEEFHEWLYTLDNDEGFEHNGWRFLRFGLSKWLQVYDAKTEEFIGVTSFKEFTKIYPFLRKPDIICNKK